MLRTVTAALALLGGCATSRPGASGAECSLTPADADAVRGVISKYRDAWMATDPAAVLAVFNSDAVLLPHHGDDPVVGLAAVERFWWPPGSPPFTLTRMEVTVDEVGGDCRIAHARGSDRIEWSSDGKAYSQRGTYLNVLRKENDGTWRISHHMWDDPMPQVR
jgi:uncharacterized protein (TIGR02246 family)